MPELTWTSFDVEAEYHESLVHRPMMLTLVAETEAGTPKVEQSTTIGAHPLVSETDMSAAAIAQSTTIDADGLVSASAMGTALVQQAATTAPLGLVSTSTTGQVGTRWMLDDFRVQKTPQETGDGTAVLAWDSPNKGLFS